MPVLLSEDRLTSVLTNAEPHFYRKTGRSVYIASSWHILMKGAVILAAVGDLDAALRAQKMAQNLIDQHRPGAE